MTNLIVITKTTKGLTSSNPEIFLQSSCYRHKQNIKIPKYKLAYKNFYHEICLFVHLSKIYSAKASYCQNSDIWEISTALV